MPLPLAGAQPVAIGEQDRSRWPQRLSRAASISFSTSSGSHEGGASGLLHFVALEPASAVEGFHCRGEPDHSSSLLREGATRSAGQFQHRGCSTSRQARHIYWPSVLRRRHSVHRCHRPWRALPRFSHGMVMCLGSGKPLAYGGARGASWPTSSMTFCYFPVWQHSSRGLSSRPRVCLSDAATPCLATLLGWCVQICENVLAIE